MVDVENILKSAIDKDASDIHLISGIKPMLRIARNLLPYDGCDALTVEDMADIYDYFIRGNVEKDNVFKETKKLDSSFEFAGLRFRVNISLSDDIETSLCLEKFTFPRSLNCFSNRSNFCSILASI